LSKRTEIIRLAIEYIKMYSFPELSYDYIAKKLNISKAAIHYYFKNKKDLGIAVCDYFEENLRQQLSDFIENPEKSAWEFIHERTRNFNSDEICPIVSIQSDLNQYDEDLRLKIIELVNLEYDVYVKILSRKLDDKTSAKYAQIHLSALKGAQLYSRTISKPFFITVFNYIENEINELNKGEPI